MRRLMITLMASFLLAAAITPASARMRPRVISFHDDFNDNSLDLSKWQPNWLAGNDTAVTNPPNTSHQNYCADPGQVSQPGDGYLHLTLLHVNAGCAVGGNTYDYRSGLVNGLTDNNLFTDTYTVTIVAYLPGGTSLTAWPALWDDCASDTTECWPDGGEIDGLEGLGGQACDHVHQDARPPKGDDQQPGHCEAMAGGWHEIKWKRTASIVKVFYDGVQTDTQDVSGFPGVAHGLILEYAVAVGGPSVSTATMLVDDVTVTQ